MLVAPEPPCAQDGADASKAVVKAQPASKYRIQFLGPKGLLTESTANSATYAFKGDEGYVRAIDLITSGVFSPGDRGLFAPLVDNLVHHDPFLVLADFRSYVDTQRDVEAAWRSPSGWAKSSILNSARAGKFSSDRSIAEYAKTIWHVQPVKLATR